MQVKIICLNAEKQKERIHPVQAIFPSASISQAADMRNISAEKLLQDKLITTTAYESITDGRKYHHEMGSTGAAGLCLSYLNALKDGEGPILICEDDCVPSPKLPNVIRKLLTLSSEFDMAIFGPLRYEHDKSDIRFPLKNFDRLNNYYWGNHALLFTGAGRQKAISHLQPPYDLQLDAHFSRLCMYGDYRAIIQFSSPPLATQLKHVSTVQTLTCPMCDLDPYSYPDSIKLSLPSVTLICLLVLVLLYKKEFKDFLKMFVKKI